MHFMAHIDKQNRFTLPFEIRELINVSPGYTAYFECKRNGLVISFSKEKDPSSNLRISTLDPKSRMVIPRVYCEFLNIKSGDFVAGYINQNRVILQSLNLYCVFCGSQISDFCVSFKEKKICEDCLKKLKHALIEDDHQ